MDKRRVLSEWVDEPGGRKVEHSICEANIDLLEEICNLPGWRYEYSFRGDRTDALVLSRLQDMHRDGMVVVSQTGKSWRGWLTERGRVMVERYSMEHPLGGLRDKPLAIRDALRKNAPAGYENPS